MISATLLPRETNSAVVVAAEPFRVLMKMQPALTRVQAKKLAKIFVEEGALAHLDWRLLASIGFNESSLGQHRFNAASADYGLMQINIKNIEALGLDPEVVKTDDRLSVRVACKILSSHRARFSVTFKHWVGTYRSGTRLGIDRVRRSAVSYDAVVRETTRRIAAYELATR